MGKTRLRSAKKGFSTIEMNGGRLVEVERDPEVMRIKREIQSRWPELEVYEDLENEEFVVICRPSDGAEYLVVATKKLTQAIIDVIAQADQASAGYVDFMKEIEDGWKQQEAEDDAKLCEIAGEAAERLAWAFRKDGLIDHENIYGPKPKPYHARKAIRVSR